MKLFRGTRIPAFGLLRIVIKEGGIGLKHFRRQFRPDGRPGRLAGQLVRHPQEGIPDFLGCKAARARLPQQAPGRIHGHAAGQRGLIRHPGRLPPCRRGHQKTHETFH